MTNIDMTMEFSEYVKLIREQNEKFNALSVEQKRMLVAQDCLVRVGYAQFIPRSCITIILDYDKADVSLESALNNQRVQCDCCVKGALFLSYVGRVNSFDIEKIENSCSPDAAEMKKLQEIFTSYELAIIEGAFEEFEIVSYDQIVEFEGSRPITEEEFDSLMNNSKIYASEVEERFHIPMDRELILSSICKNIIKNNGTFDPTDLVDPRADISFEI